MSDIISSDEDDDDELYNNIHAATPEKEVASSTEDRLRLTTRRPSARGGGRRVNYNYDDDDNDDDDDEDDGEDDGNNEEDSVGDEDDDDDDDGKSIDNDDGKDDDNDDGAVDDDAVIVLDSDNEDDDNYDYGDKTMTKKSAIKGEKNKEFIATKKMGAVVGPSMSLSLGRKTMHDDSEEEDDEKKYGQKQAAVPAASSSKNVSSPKEKKSTKVKGNADDDHVSNDRGIDIVIPHSLLDKSRGSGKNECMVLVQVANEPASSATKSSQNRPLDFHGQSGAIGRFEANGDGVILDLKGYQYRGTIRPGPTAMVVAMGRDGKLKVESITDEFVTLDAETRTDVMAKLDAVVENGSMDETYRYDGEEDVNRRTRENYGDHVDDHDKYRVNNDEGGDAKGKKKRARSGGGAANTASTKKKRKTSTTKKKKK